MRDHKIFTKGALRKEFYNLFAANPKPTIQNQQMNLLMLGKLIFLF
ncbi:hypothetical protein ZONE111905_21100 [Zobellia nedashkovskayae]